MSTKMKDGAYLTATNVVRYDCDKCGSGFLITRWPQNDREVEDFMKSTLGSSIRDSHPDTKEI